MGALASPLNLIGNAIDSLGSFFSNGLNSMGDKIWGGLGSINDNMSNLFGSIFDGLQAIYNKVFDLVDYLNPSSENFLLKIAFVPDEAYFSDKFDSLKNTLENKLSVSSYTSIMDSYKNLSGGTFQDVNVNIMGVQGKIIDSSSLNAVRNDIHKFVRGGMFLLLALYNYNQVIKLVNGRDYVASGKGESTGINLNKGV